MRLPLNVLFLCTGNSCRSIIGEALVNQRGGDRLRALSAGSHPTGKVNPGALEVLARHDVPVGRPSSKSMDDLRGSAVDLVITVCDEAAGESCPLWLEATPKVHWGLPDPGLVQGDEARVRTAFEATFTALAARTERLAALELETFDAAALVAACRDIHRRAAPV